MKFVPPVHGRGNASLSIPIPLERGNSFLSEHRGYVLAVFIDVDHVYHSPAAIPVGDGGGVPDSEGDGVVLGPVYIARGPLPFPRRQLVTLELEEVQLGRGYLLCSLVIALYELRRRRVASWDQVVAVLVLIPHPDRAAIVVHHGYLRIVVQAQHAVAGIGIKGRGYGGERVRRDYLALGQRILAVEPYLHVVVGIIAYLLGAVDAEGVVPVARFEEFYIVGLQLLEDGVDVVEFVVYVAYLHAGLSLISDGNGAGVLVVERYLFVRRVQGGAMHPAVRG